MLSLLPWIRNSSETHQRSLALITLVFWVWTVITLGNSDLWSVEKLASECFINFEFAVTRFIYLYYTTVLFIFLEKFLRFLETEQRHFDSVIFAQRNILFHPIPALVIQVLLVVESISIDSILEIILK